jgi:DNA adenine methylase
MKKGAVCYFDPPYSPVVKGSFTKYTRDDFKDEDHIRLRDLAVTLKKRGVFVLLSHSDTPYIRGLYAGKGWTLKEVRMARAINSDALKRGKVGELLIY